MAECRRDDFLFVITIRKWFAKAACYSCGINATYQFICKKKTSS